MRESDEDHPGDINPIVFFHRDGEIICVAESPGIDRDQGLQAVLVGVGGFDADGVTYVADAHMSTVALNPATGKPWGPGEMQKGCDELDACAAGVLQDALLLVHYDGKAFTQMMRPYNVDKATKTVEWLAPVEYENSKAEGLIPHNIVHAFNVAPPFTMEEIAGDADDEERKSLRQYLDTAVGGVLMSLGQSLFLLESRPAAPQTVDA